MAFIPKIENITGASLSGVSGAVNRTYSLTNANAVSAQFQIVIENAALQQTIDYTLSSNTITFLNKVGDDQDISLNYFVSTTSTVYGDNATYATTLELAKFMHIDSRIPSPKATGSDRSQELVGTGDNTTTIFYLDSAYVIANSYTIYYGADLENLTALTETTHYTLDKDLGKITLTSAGVTLVSTDKIYASYSNLCPVEVFDSQLQTFLNMAQAQIDKVTDNHWATGTDETPDYTQITNETHTGKGRTDRDYYLENFPLPNFSTTVNGAITADDVTITVVSTDGFASTGVILIDTNKIAYTGKSTTTFTGCTNVTAHDDASTVLPIVVEMSATSEGSTPIWEVLQKDTEFDIDWVTGRVHLYRDILTTPQNNSYNSYPQRLVPNRIRINYLSGNETIPSDINMVTLMIASSNVLHSNVRSSLTKGMQEFQIENINIDKNWIDTTLMNYKNDSARNT